MKIRVLLVFWHKNERKLYILNSHRYNVKVNIYQWIATFFSNIALITELKSNEAFGGYNMKRNYSAAIASVMTETRWRRSPPLKTAQHFFATTSMFYVISIERLIRF